MSGGMLFLVILATAFAVYNVLVQYGVFEINTRPKKVVNEFSARKNLNNKRKFEQQLLSFYAAPVNLFRGIFMTESCYENHIYFIERLEIRSEVLNRFLTPEEVRGKRVLPFLLSLIFVPLVFVKPIFLAVPIAGFINLAMYQTVYRTKIADEDAIIDNYFLDLYLLLYSKLRQGSRARLQSTVENYIETLESTKYSEESRVMLKLSRYMLNLLAMNEDHVAIPKLRERYHSATIINFCNVATQALNGVDNFDNLLTFKMQLTDRKTAIMRKRQQKILRAGERSIYAIWIILFIFIVVGWISKLPSGVL